MRRLLLLTSVLSFIFLVNTIAYGQKISPKNYDQFIEEVYGGTSFVTEELKAIYIERMQQVEVKKWDGKTTYPILETLHLVNKYHPEIDYDSGAQFNPERFNPLKYFFNFNVKQVFRVRDTDYIIVINK